MERDFSQGDSVLHRLDPRIRTVFGALFSAMVAVSDRFAALLPALLLSLLLLVLGRLPARGVMRVLLRVNGFMLFLWAILPFSFEGTTLLTLGPLTVTQAGTVRATLITMKCNTILMTLMALIATMPMFTLARAMRSIHVPEKIVFLLSFVYRYIHVLEKEYDRLATALKIRGFSPRNNLHTYRTYAYLVGMLLVKSYERAKRIENAMLCRGFNGTFYDLTPLSWKRSDWALLALLSLMGAGIGLLQWTRIIY